MKKTFMGLMHETEDDLWYMGGTPPIPPTLNSQMAEINHRQLRNGFWFLDLGVLLYPGKEVISVMWEIPDIGKGVPFGRRSSAGWVFVPPNRSGE